MRFLIRIPSGIGSSNDFDKMRTISWHFGVCLPMKITSFVCHQLRRARTEGLPIGDGLYGSSGITPSLPQVDRTNAVPNIRGEPCALDATSPKGCYH